MPRDDYRKFGTGNSHPAEGAAEVTPHDTNDLTVTSRSLYIGVSGDVKVDMVDGDTVTYVGVPVGVFPIRVTRVYLSGTTADSIVSMW